MCPKHEPLTPKAIAKQIKAKGLQRLRWYCQLCKKQCRDANGFKCHCMSDGHLRMLSVFGMKPGSFIDDYSRQLERDFMAVLRSTFGEARVTANKVYQEYIKDRHHVHMNSTRWTTLSGFVQHLARENKVVAEQSEDGRWKIKLVKYDQAWMIEKEKKIARLSEEDEATREMKRIDRYLEAMKKQGKFERLMETSELIRSEEDGDIQFSVRGKDSCIKNEATHAGNQKGRKQRAPLREFLIENVEEEEKLCKPLNSARPRTNLEEIVKEEGRRMSDLPTRQNPVGIDVPGALRKDSKQQPDEDGEEPWLLRGIVVKIKDSTLNEFFNKKGVVISVEDDYVGVVEMIAGGSVLKVDQANLERVIPQVGRSIKVVKGKFKGRLARLDAVELSTLTAKLVFHEVMSEEETVDNIDINFICKIDDRTV